MVKDAFVSLLSINWCFSVLEIKENANNTSFHHYFPATFVAYESPLIELNDILPPRIQKYFLTMSQTIELESSGECKNYPTSGYLNYRECDEDFVYNEMKNKYKFMPFWAAKTLSEVTKLT